MRKREPPKREEKGSNHVLMRQNGQESIDLIIAIARKICERRERNWPFDSKGRLHCRVLKNRDTPGFRQVNRPSFVLRDSE
jgi:hypothetical protein